MLTGCVSARVGEKGLGKGLGLANPDRKDRKLFPLEDCGLSVFSCPLDCSLRLQFLGLKLGLMEGMGKSFTRRDPGDTSMGRIMKPKGYFYP